MESVLRRGRAQPRQRSPNPVVGGNPSTATLSASYSGVTKTTTFTVNPASAPALATLTLNPTSVKGGTSATGTVTLTARRKALP